jgi:hypothetical protein
MFRAEAQIQVFHILVPIAWPEINKRVLTIVDDNLVDTVLEKVKKIDSINTEVGIRAIVWDVLKMV